MIALSHNQEGTEHDPSKIERNAFEYKRNLSYLFIVHDKGSFDIILLHTQFELNSVGRLT